MRNTKLKETLWHEESKQPYKETRFFKIFDFVIYSFVMYSSFFVLGAIVIAFIIYSVIILKI